MSTVFERVNLAIDAIRQGSMVIMVDDEDRENEGDLVFAAEKTTPELVNFMATHGRGLICLAMDEEYIDRLQLPMMVKKNNAQLGTAFTVSIEAATGVTTGISARDRSRTIAVAIEDEATPEDIVSPGHIFPLRARPGGVLVRSGQTEGSVDLSKLAGLKGAAVICEIMREDGEMARLPELEEFGAKHGIPIVSVADLIAFRLAQEPIVECVRTQSFRPGFLGKGEPFQTFLYKTPVEDTEYLALVRGDIRSVSQAGGEVLVRVQSVCPIGDGLGARSVLRDSLHAIDTAGVGVFLYVMNKKQTSLEHSFVRHLEGTSKVAEPGEQSRAMRDFGLGAQVLSHLGCKKISLLSDSQRKMVGIEGYGIHIVQTLPIPSRNSQLKAI